MREAEESTMTQAEQDNFGFDLTGLIDQPLDLVIRHLNSVFHYCLRNTNIEGCASPGLLDQTLMDLETLASKLAEEQPEASAPKHLSDANGIGHCSDCHGINPDGERCGHYIGCPGCYPDLI